MILEMNDYVQEDDVLALNKALMKLMIKMQDENTLLKEKVAHLEQILLQTTGHLAIKG